MTRRGYAAGLAVPMLALLVAQAGCGYSYGSGLPEQGVKTVSLTVAGNETYRQRLEVGLTAALARELPTSTDLRLAAPGRGDATLWITITDARERTLVPGSRTDPVREGSLEATVRMRLVRADGKTLLDRTVVDRAEFRSPIGEDLASAGTELVDDLARKIALALEAGL
ncbi:MAG: hypothetical protein RL398_2187 [Planctomycetota bacterium]